VAQLGGVNPSDAGPFPKAGDEKLARRRSDLLGRAGPPLAPPSETQFREAV